MQDDTPARNENDKPTDGSDQRRRSTDPDDNKGQRTLETPSETATAPPGEEGGDEGNTDPPSFEDGLDDATGSQASANYHRAVSDYDPTDDQPQISEHWGYNSQEPGYRNNGHF